MIYNKNDLKQTKISFLFSEKKGIYINFYIAFFFLNGNNTTTIKIILAMNLP